MNVYMQIVHSLAESVLLGHCYRPKGETIIPPVWDLRLTHCYPNDTLSAEQLVDHVVVHALQMMRQC